jgi:hypothetical protein
LGEFSLLLIREAVVGVSGRCRLIDCFLFFGLAFLLFEVYNVIIDKMHGSGQVAKCILTENKHHGL